MLFLFFAFFTPPAQALDSSPNAFRLEDAKEGNVVIGADHARIHAGEIYKNVVLLWGNLEIEGQVEEVLVLSGKVTFEPGAKLTKSLVVMGGSFESRPGAEVTAEQVTLQAPGLFWRSLRVAGQAWQQNIGWVLKLAGALASVLLLWLVGLLYFRIAPRASAATADRLFSEWAPNLLAGLLGTIMAPVLMALLVISILGILALPLYFLLLFAAGIASYLAAARWVGHRLLPPAPERKVNPWGFLLGLIVLQFFWSVGGWAWVLALAFWTLAWGSLLRGLRGLFR